MSYYEDFGNACLADEINEVVQLMKAANPGEKLQVVMPPPTFDAIVDLVSYPIPYSTKPHFSGLPIVFSSEFPEYKVQIAEVS